MIGVSAGIDLKVVEEGLDELLRSGRSAARVLGAFKTTARKDQASHGKARESSSGAKWAPRSAATTQGRGKRRARIRRRRLLGRLSTALNITTTPSSLVVTSKIPWSGIHQDGGTAGRGSRIPAREFLWWSEELLERVAFAIVSNTMERW